MKLRWLTDSEGFEIEDADAVAAQKAAELDNATAWIARYVNDHPGLSRSKVEEAYKTAHDGGRNRARTAIDRQLEALKEWEQTGEHPPLLATTVGEARNGTYLIPFSQACSPLAAHLNSEGGEHSPSPTETGAARRSPLAYKGEQEGGEQRDGTPDEHEIERLAALAEETNR